MARMYKEVRTQSVSQDADPDVVVTRDDGYGTFTAARIVSLIGSVIVSLLALRFILSLLGANRANAFASFVYSVTHPFVAPFFGLFNYQEQIGVVRFEFETLVAMAFWAFVTWLIVRAIAIGTHSRAV